MPPYMSITYIIDKLAGCGNITQVKKLISCHVTFAA